MKYQSELIKEIVEARGHEKSSLHYESECVELWVEETKGSYPKLCDYQSEWLNYINENPVGEFPYETIIDVTDATVDNVVPYAYKSAILKGSTKYRDIDTGEVLDAFEDGRNLELVSVKMPVLTTSTFIPMYSFLKDDGKENFTKLYTEFYEVTKDTFTFKQSYHYQRIGITTDNFKKEGKQTLERNKEYQFKIEVLENTLSIDMEIRCDSRYTDGVKELLKLVRHQPMCLAKRLRMKYPKMTCMVVEK